VLARGAEEHAISGPEEARPGDRLKTRGAPARFTLPGGARVWLDAASEVALARDAGFTRLTVASGEAFVDAPRGTRDLRVGTAGAETMIEGTAFGVRREGAVTRVAVEHGRVRVLAGGRESAATTGTAVSAGPSGVGAAQPWDVTRPPTAWRWTVESGPASAPPDPAAVEAAVTRGAAYLSANVRSFLGDFTWPDSPNQSKDALVLMALASAGAPRDGAAFRQALEASLARPVATTYRAATLAQALAAIDAKAHAARLRDCAQFLVDNQCANGQWDYGRPVEASPPAGALRRRAAGRPSGDNVNTAFALAGLDACEAAGVRAPKETWKQAAAWLRSSQREDGGWSYSVAPGEASYLSATEGSLAGLVTCLRHLGEDWKRDPAVHGGVYFVNTRFSLTENPFKGVEETTYQYYHLYALLQAARATGMERWGGRTARDAVAAYLLPQQGTDGHWISRFRIGDYGQDTCFAILALRAAGRR
jgi:hypothetical protein